MTPHLDGLTLNAQTLGDVVRANRITCHRPIITCNPRVDKCNARVYTKTMTTTQTPETVKDARGVTYEVIYSKETSEAMRQGGCVWTHFCGLRRPKGARTFIMWANRDENGEIVRRSNITGGF
jgi:hypothetical protein